MSKRQLRPYTEALRKSSAQRVLQSGKGLFQIAEELGVNATTLHGWVSKYTPHKKYIKRSWCSSKYEPPRELLG